MCFALGQLDGSSSKFETGAVAGLMERRKLCLRSANLRRAPQARPSRDGDVTQFR